MNAQEKLVFYKNSFDKIFREYFKDLDIVFKYPHQSEFIPKCITLIKELSLRGGKRQRVAFLYESYKLFGKTSDTDFLKTCAISIELLQTHLLIHDDLIDNSPTRRGGPTTYFALKKLLFNKGIDIVSASSLTILTGDIAAFLVVDVLLRKENFPGKMLRKIIDIQISAALNTFSGQIFDIERDTLKNLSEEDLTTLADFKAVRSSGLAPMLIGLTLAGKDTAANVSKVTRYVTQIGIAAQIQDDILGLFGNPDVTGKSNISDVKEGKRTFLVMHTLKHCDLKDRRFIESILGNSNASDKDLTKFKKIVEKSGSLDYAKTLAKKHAERAIREVSLWNNANNGAVNFFSEVSNLAIHRQL